MKTLLLIMQIIPSLFAAIKALDTAFPQAGLGKIKLDLLQKTMQVAFDGISEIWPKIADIVALFVSTSNSIQKSDEPAKPDVVPPVQ